MLNIHESRRLVSVVILVTLIVTSLLVYSKPVGAVDQRDYSQAFDACEQFESKLKSKTGEFYEKRQKHIDKYQQIAGIYESASQTLTNAGYDTDILFELKPGLDRRIANFEQTSQMFLSELSDSSDSACRDRASFTQELLEAREALKEVQFSVSDIQKYIQDILIPSVEGVVSAGAQ